MTGLLSGLRRVCAVVERVLEWLVIAIVAVLVLSVLWGIFSRSEFALLLGISPSLWTEELPRLLLIWVTFLGAALCFEKRQHLGLDYFASLLHTDAQRWLQAIGEVVVIAFAAVVLVAGGGFLVSETLQAQQTTAAMQLKMGHVYLAAPIAGVATLLFCLKRLLGLLAEAETADDSNQPHAGSAD